MKVVSRRWTVLVAVGGILLLICASVCPLPCGNTIVGKSQRTHIECIKSGRPVWGRSGEKARDLEGEVSHVVHELSGEVRWRCTGCVTKGQLDQEAVVASGFWRTKLESNSLSQRIQRSQRSRERR